MKLPTLSQPAGSLNPGAKIPAKSRQGRSLKTIKPRRKMSSLEKLPTELLLQIFFYSMNLDLPRASPIIAGKLSDEHTFIRTIMMVFDLSWAYRYESMHGFRKGERPLPSYNLNVSDLQDYCESSKAFIILKNQQSALLRCRCSTLTRLRKAEETWLRHVAAERDLVALGKVTTSTIYGIQILLNHC